MTEVLFWGWMRDRQGLCHVGGFVVRWCGFGDEFGGDSEGHHKCDHWGVQANDFVSDDQVNCKVCFHGQR